MATPVSNVFYALTGPKRMEKLSNTLGEVPDHWARLRFHYCGICGSDVSYYNDLRNPKFPMPLGHEFVAEVEACGDGVEDLQVGDLVTSDLQYRCGECENCQKQRSHLCSKGGIGLFSNRAYAWRADMHASYLYRLPGFEPQPKMTLTEPLSCVLHGMESIDFDCYERVLLVGAGSIGMCMAFALHCKGVRFDVLEKNPQRLDRIKACVSGSIPEGQYDLVFDSSGTPGGMLKAAEFLAHCGMLVSMSHVDGMHQDERFLTLFSRKDAILKMPYLNGDGFQMDRAIALLDAHWNGPWDDLLSIHPGEELIDLFAERTAYNDNKSIIDCSTISALTVEDVLTNTETVTTT